MTNIPDNQSKPIVFSKSFSIGPDEIKAYFHKSLNAAEHTRLSAFVVGQTKYLVALLLIILGVVLLAKPDIQIIVLLCVVFLLVVGFQAATFFQNKKQRVGLAQKINRYNKPLIGNLKVTHDAIICKLNKRKDMLALKSSRIELVSGVSYRIKDQDSKQYIILPKIVLSDHEASQLEKLINNS